MLINEVIKKQLQKREDICFMYNGQKLSIPQIEQLDVPNISLTVCKKSIQVEQFDLNKRYKFVLSKSLTLSSEFHNIYNNGIPIPETTLYGQVKYKVDGYIYVDVAARLGVRWFGWIDNECIVLMEEY